MAGSFYKRIVKIIGIDTSGVHCSVGIITGDLEPIVKEHLGQDYNERLFSLMQEALNEAKIERTDIEGIAVCIGPGSFTGLRVGLSAAKGIAHALNIPISGVSSLDVLASQASPGDYPVCSIVQSKGEKVAYRIYEVFETEKHKGDFMEGTWTDVFADAKMVKNVYGSITDDKVSQLKEKLPKGVMVSQKYTSGALVAEIGRERIQRGHTDDLVNLAPLYAHAITFQEKRRQDRK